MMTGRNRPNPSVQGDLCVTLSFPVLAEKNQEGVGLEYLSGPFHYKQSNNYQR